MNLATPIQRSILSVEQPSEIAPPKDVSEEERCRYQSKRCLNIRALKKNGELHNLCDFHRSKANSNQRKLDRKKRHEARHSPYSRKSSFSSNASTPSSLASPSHQVAALSMFTDRPEYMYQHSPKFPTVIRPSESVGQSRENQLNMDDFQFLVECFSHERPQPVPMNKQTISDGRLNLPPVSEYTQELIMYHSTPQATPNPMYFEF